MRAAIIGALAIGVSCRGPVPHGDSTGKAFLIVRSESSSLTWEDVRAIKAEVPSVALAVPYLQKTLQVVQGDMNWSTQVVGTTDEYFDLMGLRMAAGNRFDTDSKAVVLGETTVAQLYGAGKTPVGEVVRIKDVPFTITGVFAHRGMSPQGQDLDDVALVPIEVYRAKFEPTTGFGGAVLLGAKADLAHVEAEVRRLLRDHHHLAAGDADDFVIRTSPLQ
jgi:putative ABC transport system permease protein